MTATYTNQPGTRDVDTVRLLVYDRDTIPATDARLSDEEIQYFIDANTHINFAAAEAALAIAAKHAPSGGSKKVGDLVIEGTAMTYRELSEQLRLKATRKVTAYAGGLSDAEKKTRRQDTDLPDPAFRVGKDDHRRSGSTVDVGIIEY